MKQIYEQVESTSFDTPDSWEKELRARRVSLRNDKGLVVQCSRLQRGWQLPNLGPANSGGEWINLFDNEAPVASEFSFLPEAHSGHKDFVVAVSGYRKLCHLPFSTASSIAKPNAT